MTHGIAPAVKHRRFAPEQDADALCGSCVAAGRKKANTIEDLRLCRGSSFDQFSTTKRGTPASQAPQEFQNIYPIPTTTVFIPSTAKSGGLHIVSPQFRQKCNCEKIASYLHKMPCIREPLRAARAVPLLHFWGETSPRIQLRPEGRGTRTAIPLITILNSLSFLHLGSDGSAFPRQSVFPYKKKGKRR